MVPGPLARRAGNPARAAAVAVALTLAACGGGGEAPAAADSTATARAAQRVRREYTARDLVAAGAFTWQSDSGGTFVLIDVQSTIEALVQARADLWVVKDSVALPLARSDVMPSAAEFGAWAFEDLTGDGIPDFFGYVADSAGVSYPVFLPGAMGALSDEIATAAPGYRFDTIDSIPTVISGVFGNCALRLWAEDPVPDGADAGWRYLPMLEGGRLMAPVARQPDCG
jgi:hypothetical protein